MRQAEQALRAASRYYERHVIAWHALGRHREATIARNAIAHSREQLGATMLVTVRVDLATETISGALTTEEEPEQRFWGWMELSGALDALRRNAGTNSARRNDGP